MPNNINVTVELGAEDRARLDRIIELLSGLSITEVVEVTATTEVEVAAAPEEQPSVTMADIQALAQKLAAPTTGKRNAVRDIVKKYAKSISAIPEDKWTEVHKALSDLM